MSDRLDMSGMWEGTYVYPGYQGPTTPFVATLSEADGRLTGSTLEPDLVGFAKTPGELEATIVGMRDGTAIDFIKTYREPLSHERIDYVGKLSDDGLVVTGVWSNGALDGTFEMRREAGWEEAVSQQEAAPLETELTVPQSADAPAPSAGDA
jgi:hypothetical protein